MRHFAVQRCAPLILCATLAQCLVACGADTDHGPVIGIPSGATGPVVVEGAGNGSGGANQGGSAPGGANGGAFDSGAGNSFGLGGNGTGGSDRFGTGRAGSDPFGIGGKGTSDRFGLAGSPGAFGGASFF